MDVRAAVLDADAHEADLLEDGGALVAAAGGQGDAAAGLGAGRAGEGEGGEPRGRRETSVHERSSWKAG